MSKGKHTLYAHDLQMPKNLIMQCPEAKDATSTLNGCVAIPALEYTALWELKRLVEEILEDVEE
jgi:undecaprenyl pyrophosphate synthase